MQSESNKPVKFPELSDFLRSDPKEAQIKTISLVSYDLLSPDDPDREIVNNKIRGVEPFKNQKESKAFGSFAGLAIGDALGYFLEGAHLDYKRNYLKGFENVSDVIKSKDLHSLPCEPGQYSDDTALSLCLADSLIVNNLHFKHKDIRHRFYQWYFNGYNNGRNLETIESKKYSRGIGTVTFNSCIQFLNDPTEKVPNTDTNRRENGNGTVMRVVAIPIAYSYDLRKCMINAIEQSYTTHDGEEAAECCKLLTFVVWNFLNLSSVAAAKALMEELGSLFQSKSISVQSLADSKQESKDTLNKYDPLFNRTVEDRDWNWKNPHFKYSKFRSEMAPDMIGIYCMDTVAMSFHIVYYTKSFKEALLKAVNLGGDSDTVGAIVGMLAGALYGFDEDVSKMYIDYVAKWDEQKVVLRAYKLFKLSEEKEISRW